MPFAADDQLRALDQRLQRARQRLDPVLADADDIEPDAHASTPGMASASPLIAAAAIALPPRLPRNVRYGMPKFASMSACFDSAAPTKPTGNAKMLAGFVRPLRSFQANGTVP